MHYNFMGLPPGGIWRSNGGNPQTPLSSPGRNQPVTRDTFELLFCYLLKCSKVEIQWQESKSYKLLTLQAKIHLSLWLPRLLHSYQHRIRYFHFIFEGVSSLVSSSILSFISQKSALMGISSRFTLLLASVASFALVQAAVIQSGTNREELEDAATRILTKLSGCEHVLQGIL